MLYVRFTEYRKKSAHIFASLVVAQILSRSKSIPSDSQLELIDQTSTMLFFSLFFFPLILNPTRPNSHELVGCPYSGI
jgi:hypothetical protein